MISPEESVAPRIFSGSKPLSNPCSLSPSWDAFFFAVCTLSFVGVVDLRFFDSSFFAPVPAAARDSGGECEYNVPTTWTPCCCCAKFANSSLTVLFLLFAVRLECANQVRAVQVLLGLPGVVLGRVTLPLQEVLDLQVNVNKCRNRVSISKPGPRVNLNLPFHSAPAGRSPSPRSTPLAPSRMSFCSS